LGDEAGLAHAGHHEVALAGEDGVDGGVELRAQAIGQRLHRRRLDFEDLASLVAIHEAADYSRVDTPRKRPDNRGTATCANEKADTRRRTRSTAISSTASS